MTAASACDTLDSFRKRLKVVRPSTNPSCLGALIIAVDVLKVLRIINEATLYCEGSIAMGYFNLHPAFVLKYDLFAAEVQLLLYFHVTSNGLETLSPSLIDSLID